MNATFIREITLRARAMTTRKLTRLSGVALALAGLALPGCATRGALHVYAVSAGPAQPILDAGPPGSQEVPSFLEPDDTLTGFAYDPFTDHFFLRLAPGNRIRVVDRPARAIKREFTVDGAPPAAGDLAVRPRDGHLYLLGARTGEIIECTRLGKLVGTFSLDQISGHPIGLALDATNDHLLALGPDGRRVTVHDRRGRFLREFRLQSQAGPALAFDADRGECLAPLAGRKGEIGVFDAAGRLTRTQVLPGATPLVDAGPRSFLRVF
jgi:hypothetical protein